MLWVFFFVVVSFVTGSLPWHPCMYTDELWMWTYFMDWDFPLNFVVKPQRHCNRGSRKLVLKLEWSNWSHTAFAFCQLCLSASDAVSLCVLWHLRQVKSLRNSLGGKVSPSRSTSHLPAGKPSSGWSVWIQLKRGGGTGMEKMSKTASLLISRKHNVHFKKVTDRKRICLRGKAQHLSHSSFMLAFLHFL